MVKTEEKQRKQNAKNKNKVKKFSSFKEADGEKKEKEVKPVQIQKKRSPLEIIRDKEVKKAKLAGMKGKAKGKGFSARVTDRNDSQSICDYLNSEVARHIKYRLDKRDNKKPITSEEAMCLTVSKQLTDDTLLFAPKNISTYLGAETDIQAVVELSIDSLKEKKKVVSSFDTPQIVVLTQDTLMVTKLYKALRDKYALSKGLAKGGIEVRVWKLFARHIPIKDQEEALKVKNEGQIINVFIGTPNRIKALA
jgi:hypothetical protein